MEITKQLKLFTLITEYSLVFTVLNEFHHINIQLYNYKLYM